MKIRMTLNEYSANDWYSVLTATGWMRLEGAPRKVRGSVLELTYA